MLNDIKELVKQCKSYGVYCSSELYGRRVCNLSHEKIDCKYQKDEQIEHGRFTKYYICGAEKWVGLTFLIQEMLNNGIRKPKKTRV